MLTAEQLGEVTAAKKGGLFDKVTQRARADMNEQFILNVKPQQSETILDVGASANPAFIASNYLEWKYPTLTITALGLGAENPTWKKLYPNIPYISGNALDLPFGDNHFDIVYSHAVIEHVGHFQNQVNMISEAIRVAKRAVWLTTPFRWHPLEFHTVLPFLHWLPKSLHRFMLRHIGMPYFAVEETLNLLDYQDLHAALKLAAKDQQIESMIHVSKFLGITANLLLQINKKSSPG